MPVEKAITSGFADVPGARLYYEIAGEGDPILLLHGGLLDRRIWTGSFHFSRNTLKRFAMIPAVQQRESLYPKSSDPHRFNRD